MDCAGQGSGDPRTRRRRWSQPEILKLHRPRVDQVVEGLAGLCSGGTGKARVIRSSGMDPIGWLILAAIVVVVAVVVFVVIRRRRRGGGVIATKGKR